jgi:uncharacterized membrane protein YphA (DoxX/SURF4 family)
MNEVLILFLRVVTSVSFLVSGAAKLVRSRRSVAQFKDFHLPPEIMYLVGTAEIAGVIGLWFGVLELWAYSCLGCLMLGALKSHIQAKHRIVKLLPALVLFVMCVAGALYVNWLR